MSDARCHVYVCVKSKITHKVSNVYNIPNIDDVWHCVTKVQLIELPKPPLAKDVLKMSLTDTHLTLFRI